MPVEVEVFKWSGKLDTAHAVANLDAAMGRSASHQVLNARDLVLINSSGFGFLIRSQRRLRERGGELVISEPAPRIAKMIETLGLRELFRVFETDKDALAYFADQGGAAVTAHRTPIGPDG